jgi:hypothetical protein
MNEKARFYRIGFVCLLLIVFGTGIVSCRSVGTVTDQSVLDYQRQITQFAERDKQLTDRIDKYDSIVGASVERLTDIGIRAATMGNEIADIIFLFGLYQSEVQRLIDEYKRLQSEIRGTE